MGCDVLSNFCCSPLSLYKYHWNSSTTYTMAEETVELKKNLPVAETQAAKEPEKGLSEDAWVTLRLPAFSTFHVH